MRGANVLVLLSAVLLLSGCLSGQELVKSYERDSESNGDAVVTFQATESKRDFRIVADARDGSRGEVELYVTDAANFGPGL